MKIKEYLDGMRESLKAASASLADEKAAVLAMAAADYPDADEIKPGMYEGQFYAEVWRHHVGTAIFYSDEEILAWIQ